MTMRLADKVAIVTGGGSGIGAATSTRFAAEGASVVVSDVNEDAASETVTTITEAGGRATSQRADVSVASDAEAMVEAAVESFGGLDILVNNAGIERNGSVVAMSEEDWDAVFAVNLKGGFLCSKFAIPKIRERGGGSVLFTASVGGLWGSTGAAAYSAAKAAVINLTQTMALDHAHHGIRVNCVCPGGTRTPLATSLAEELGMMDLLEEQLKTMVPLGGGLAEPGQIADVFLFLASDEASFVTGEAIAVDGGQRAGLFIPELLEP